MKKMICEICGGKEFIKENGVFVCQSCEMKYTLEDVKKIMENEGSFSEEETAEVIKDSSKKLDNLYEIARRARREDNAVNAAEYYQKILYEDPSSWEANYFTLYYQAMQCKVGEIGLAATNMKNCQKEVILIIKNNLNEEEQIKVLKEVASRNATISDMLATSALNSLNELGHSAVSFKHRPEYVDKATKAVDILYEFGVQIETVYGGSKPFIDIAVDIWKQAKKNIHIYSKSVGSVYFNEERFDSCISKYDSDVAIELKQKKQREREANVRLLKKEINNHKKEIEEWEKYVAPGRYKKGIIVLSILLVATIGCVIYRHNNNGYINVGFNLYYPMIMMVLIFLSFSVVVFMAFMSFSITSYKNKIEKSKKVLQNLEKQLKDLEATSSK